MCVQSTKSLCNSLHQQDDDHSNNDISQLQYSWIQKPWQEEITVAEDSDGSLTAFCIKEFT